MNVVDPCDYEAVKEYLYSLKFHGPKYGVDRMRLLADVLGHPERAFPVIHVAGTNGKGSTCAMLEAVYRASGRSCGLFTSPHLVHLGERIQIGRRSMSQEEILAHVREIMPLARRIGEACPDDHPSFFEFLTAMGLVAFARAKVDVAMVEVGLGGRLDATNVVDPALSIITSIGYDHTEILGDTLERIAYEKAGIIKPGRPVLIGCLPPEAEKVVREVAAERDCQLYSVREHFGDDDATYPATNLAGHHQRRNAAMATLATRILADLLPVDGATVERALQNVVWEGRWDSRRLPDGRTIIFDASHNEEGAQMLGDNLAALVRETGRQPLIVCGSLGQRRARAVVGMVARHASGIVLVRPAQERACTLDELAACVPAGFEGTVTRSTVRTIVPSRGVFTLGQPGDTIVVTGSIYLLGEVMEALFCERPVHEEYLQDAPGSKRLPIAG
jgi:dihydrofolate synthase/folylpolyglutamate synthase